MTDGQPDKIRKEGQAQADVIRMVSEAEGDVMRAKGLAEAKARRRRRRRGRSTAGRPWPRSSSSNCRRCGAGREAAGEHREHHHGSNSPSRLVENVVNIATQAPALVKSLTGVNVSDLATALKDLKE